MVDRSSGLEHFKEKLKIRHTPKPEKGFSVKIKKIQAPESFFYPKEEDPEKDGDEEDGDEEDEEDEPEQEKDKPKKDKTEGLKKPRTEPAKIIDKSKTFAIDRDLVMKSIRDAKRNKIIEKSARKEDAVLVTSKKIDEKESEITLEKKTDLEEEEDDEKESKKPEIEEEENKKKRIKIGEPKVKKVTIQETAEENPPVVVKPSTGRKIKIVSKLTIKEPLVDHPLLADRLPPIEKSVHRVSNYYMTNRKLAMTKLQQLFEPERREFMENKETVSCDTTGSASFELLPHQKIAREYLNIYTPYRGLLLYFSLGSGKSCTSIAIAEGMKSDKHIFVMTPASLKMNFFTELKKCGDKLFKKDQFWEFVSIDGHPDYIEVLSNALHIPKELVKRNKGAWLVDVQKPANFSELSGTQQKQIDKQLNQMIRSKYTDLNYNGINTSILRQLTDDFTTNPFDHSVVVIDEAHNFVSRIVNKIKRKTSVSYMLYDLLLKATDCRVVLLTGTPIINYPNEIGILYNILRGYIKTWIFHLNVKSNQKVNRDTILDMFDKANFRTYDYVEYSGNKLIITRNPFGFINTRKPGPRGAPKGGKVRKITQKTHKPSRRSTKKSQKKPVDAVIRYEMEHPENTEELRREIDQQAEGVRISGMDYDRISTVYGGESQVMNRYNGVRLDETGNVSDEDFMRSVVRILSKNDIEVFEGATEVKLYKALPDDSESFLNMFVDADSASIKNKRLFQRRILGLTSYYRSAQEQLLPSLVEDPEAEEGNKSVFHVMYAEMSDYQFENYSKIRKEEREQEKTSKKNAKRANAGEQDMYSMSSTYRIFSRACCNFVFPHPPGRPMPDRKKDNMISESVFDATPAKVIQDVDVYGEEINNDEEENVSEETVAEAYSERITRALQFLNEHADEYLTPEALKMYSPKFLQVLENLKDENNTGLHLLYSQFRTIEGIGILKLILEANGFEQLRVTQNAGNEWSMVTPTDITKPRFLLYTGTESPEERELLRNIYNSQWDVLPPGLATQLREIAENNFMGEIVKIMMITSSGAEGINLRNTRFVHIVEPYWHMVRLEQVIGRARRICSHQDLPEELRTVKVFLYLATFTEEQRTSDKNKELVINDVSRLDKKTPITTDENLYEISRIKDTINQQLLKSVKESAIDCAIYASSNTKENLVCYGYGKVTSNEFGSFPSLEEDEQQKDDLNVKKEKLKLRKITVGKESYALDEATRTVYDLESYVRSKTTGENLVIVGRLDKVKGRLVIVPQE
jgi:hypothetical protein